jgi:hypothetical protein
MERSKLAATFADVVGAICKYPMMYTMNGKFAEVVAFIEGYTSADSVKNSRIEWHGFSRWLAKRFEYSDAIVAAEYLRERYPSDDEAIDELAHKYAEYALTKDQM